MNLFDFDKIEDLASAYTMKVCGCGEEYKIIFFDPGHCEECRGYCMVCGRVGVEVGEVETHPELGEEGPFRVCFDCN
jgi:hypothetical protein